MPRISKAKIIFLIFMIEAILSLSFFNLYADTQAKPQRPWYSETPNPRHIANYDRLTAEYFNNQLNVIYNWAQNTNTELDNLLHNGIGVASLTVGILNCTNKILSPALELQGRTQPSPPVNNGMIYFDSELQRFRVYQENGWRDLSSNYIIDGNTLTNPLIINGYLESSNLYVNENASITKNLNVGGNASITKNLAVKGRLNASGPATLESLKVNKAMKVPVTASTTLGVGSVYYDTTAGKLKVFNSSNNWDTVGNDITVDDALSETSTNPLQNKVITTNFRQIGMAFANTISDVATSTVNGTIKVTKNGSSTNVSVKGLGSAAYANVASFAAPITVDSSISDSSTNPVQNKKVKEYVDTLSQTITNNYVYNVQEGDSSGTIKVTRGLQNINVKVHGLGDAAYANVASISSSIGSGKRVFTNSNSTPVYLMIDTQPGYQDGGFYIPYNKSFGTCSYNFYKITDSYYRLIGKLTIASTTAFSIATDTYYGAVINDLETYDNDAWEKLQNEGFNLNRLSSDCIFCNGYRENPYDAHNVHDGLALSDYLFMEWWVSQTMTSTPSYSYPNVAFVFYFKKGYDFDRAEGISFIFTADYFKY